MWLCSAQLVSYLNPSNAMYVKLNIEGEEDSNFHGQQRLLFMPWPFFVLAQKSKIYFSKEPVNYLSITAFCVQEWLVPSLIKRVQLFKNHAYLALPSLNKFISRDLLKLKTCQIWKCLNFDINKMYILRPKIACFGGGRG